MDKAGLLRSGWEAAEVAHAEGRPRRRTYTLSSAGREALGEADAKLAEVRRLLGDLGPATAGEA
jgi:DNA-binding PadR family transcriptional regulator